MLVKISQHLKKLAASSKAVRRQFYRSKEESHFSERAFIDPLLEDKFSPVKGLCWKYSKRVLIELTMDCASFCRFCTRRRKVSDIKKGMLKEKDISALASYIESKPEISEVIFSGGDPLLVPGLLILALKKITSLTQVKIIRIHTRVPVSDPKLLSKNVLRTLSRIKKIPVYLSIHFEHPDELTPATIKAVRELRKTGAILLSQSVFLKNINDSYPVLEKLFTRLTELGIRPYYIYHCDLGRGIEHFIVPIEKEIRIMTKLRKNLSGISFPFHVIDSPNGSGKIPVPLNFWQFNKARFKDFNGKRIDAYGPPLKRFIKIPGFFPKDIATLPLPQKSWSPPSAEKQPSFARLRPRKPSETDLGNAPKVEKNNFLNA
ncbi:MAG: KamA family radical SAM protein [Candidatus Nealsonbacteria bacterium]|nr:KamA family radical SAM protein [Candidatus Nealsonbacteria bacterium]